MESVNLKCEKCENTNNSYNWTKATKKCIQSASNIEFHLDDKTVNPKYMFICPGCNEWIDGERIIIVDND